MLAWALVVGLLGAPDRIVLLPVNGAGLTQAEIARVKSTVTKKLKRVSGACIVPMEKIEAARTRGMPLAELQLCGVSMTEALSTPHRVSINIAKGDGRYLGIFKLDLGPPMNVKRRENLEANNLRGILRIVSAAITRNIRGAASGAP